MASDGASDRPVPEDYESGDGFREDGLEQCPPCGRQLSGETGYHGRVYDTRGREYDHILDTEVGEGPHFCPECWTELDMNRKAERNQALDSFESTDETDRACETCGAGSSFTIPVWEDISDYYKKGSPDYIGCTECHTMREVDDGE